MPASAKASIEQDGERFVLCFERSLPHPPEVIWSALTETDRLREWHPTPFELDRGAGTDVHFIAEASPVEIGDGELLEYDPPRTLAYTWFEDELRWELEPTPEGCRLSLRHTFSDRFKAARDAAGWDVCLEWLVASLAGTPAPPEVRSKLVPDGWAKLNAEYQLRFEIPPELASPPPVS